MIKPSDKDRDSFIQKNLFCVEGKTLLRNRRNIATHLMTPSCPMNVGSMMEEKFKNCVV